MNKEISHIYIDNNAKETILFLHGWGCNKEYMLPLSKSKKYNSLIIDIPGFGSNSPLLFPYKLDDFTEEILLFLENKKIEISYIVGHSFGGKLACKLYSNLNLKGLILIAPSIFNKFRGPIYYLKVTFYKIIKHFKCFKNKLNNFGSKDYKVLSPIMKKTMSNVINESLITELKEIKIPTILLFGKKDKITPLYLAKKIKKYIDDCELITLDGNHFAYLYQKAFTINIIESMVKTC